MLSSASPRARHRIVVALAASGLAFATVAGCTPRASAPGASEGAPAEDAMLERTTTVTPSSLNPADIKAPPHQLLPAVCGTVGLSVEQVAEITGIPLAESDPTLPSGRPEMCVYGGLWSDLSAQLELLERTDSADPTAPGDKKPGGTSATTSTATTATSSASPSAGPTTATSSTSPSTTPSSTPTSTAPAEPQETSSVFISALPLDGREDDLLETLPTTLGPAYSCTIDDDKVEVPNIAELKAQPLHWRQMTTWLLPPEGSEPPDEPPTTTRPTPTPLQNQQAGKKIDAEILRCDTDPPNTAPQVELFFLSEDAVWQISAVVPDLAEDAPDPDEQYQGLRSLAGYLIGGL